MILLEAYNKEIGIRVNGSKFWEVIDLLKSRYFRYDTSHQAWFAPVPKINATLPFFQEIDHVRVSTPAQELIDYFVYNKETKQFPDRKADFSLYVISPFVGKPPYTTFQSDDLQRCFSQNRLYLAHEQGLGKGVILVNLINQLWSQKLIDKVLVLVPAEALINWKRELLKFSSFFNPSDISIASVINRSPFFDNAKIVISTYRSFLMISDDYYKQNHPNQKRIPKYKNSTIPFDGWGTSRMLICDEAHLIKNRTTRSFSVVNLHKHFFEYRYMASGTPAPNSIADWYAQMKILDESIIPEDYYSWIPQMADVGNRFSQFAINYFYPDKVEKFVNQISPWVIRRFAKDCLDLPPLQVKKIYVALNPIQEEIYIRMTESIILKITEEMDKDTKKSVDIVKQIINRFPFLQLAIDNPSILTENDIREYKFGEYVNKLIRNFKIVDHSKIDAVTGLIEDYIGIQGKKIIVWSGHPKTLNQLGELYQKYNPIIIHGQNNDRGVARDEKIERFKSKDGPSLLLGSYEVMSTAINLTQATVSIYFDRSYDLTDWLQSIRRIYRIGQNDSVIIHPIIAENTIDEQLDKKLDMKENINSYLFGRGTLTSEEWKKLFRGETLENAD